MTDPRMLRLLALTNELHAIVAELGASISLTGSKYDGGSDGSIHIHGILPPGMSALDFKWSAIGDGYVGKYAAGMARVVVYLDTTQRHLVADLLPAEAVSA